MSKRNIIYGFVLSFVFATIGTFLQSTAIGGSVSHQVAEQIFGGMNDASCQFSTTCDTSSSCDTYTSSDKCVGNYVYNKTQSARKCGSENTTSTCDTETPVECAKKKACIWNSSSNTCSNGGELTMYAPIACVP